MNNEPTRFCLPLWLLLIFVAAPSRLLAQECDTCDPCEPCCPPPTCTVLVPKMVTEYQTQYVTRYRTETRQRMVTVYRDVPTTQTLQEKYTVRVPQNRTRTVAETINHPIYGDIQLRTTAMTPEVEVRQASQTVTRLAPVQEERVACASPSPPLTPPLAAASPDPDPNAPPPADPASPADPPAVAGACNSCNSPCAPCKVCTTCWRPVSQQVTVQYPLTRFKPEARLATVAFYEYQPETKVHEETYVVQVPETRTRTRQITVMRPVAEQRPEQYKVLVSYQEPIQVPIVRCVEEPVIIR